MPKRFQIGPLEENTENWLIIWAALLTKNKVTLAKELVGLQVRRHKAIIQELLENAAESRGLDPDELFRKLLANPLYLKESQIDQDSHKGQQP
ncbi:MAG: hypothetical protein QNJ46_02375 [Leptolyngbyaceae cyanobacterium MO_188.B28]|nr:hypothetical protein [Leptolyngbyaceae cyanobacterium MO_188.B28]